MATLRMAQPQTVTPTVHYQGFRTSTRLLRITSWLLVLVLLATCSIVLLRLREDALRGTERHLSDVALTLAEQADRAVQGMDLVLDGIAHQAVSEGAVDAATFNGIMSTREVHTAMQARMIGLPQINALILFGVDGNMVNTTRSWPVPSVNVRDAAYFQEAISDGAADLSFTAPFQFKTDGKWTVLLIRKYRGVDGNAAGLLVAAVELNYFEEFYRSVSVGNDGTISLLRGDGVQLARYPPAPTTGRNFMTAQRILADAKFGTLREPSPFDQTMRVKAARRSGASALALLDAALRS
jgi:hypothetical protein